MLLCLHFSNNEYNIFVVFGNQRITYEAGSGEKTFGKVSFPAFLHFVGKKNELKYNSSTNKLSQKVFHIYTTFNW